MTTTFTLGVATLDGASAGSHTISVTRNAGEGLMLQLQYANGVSITSIKWDPTGANESFAVVDDQLGNNLGGSRRGALYTLPNPTGTGTKNVTVTWGSATAAGLVAHKMSGHDLTSPVRNHNPREEPLPIENDLPNTVTTVSGDAVLFTGYMRDNPTWFSAGAGISNFGSFSVGGGAITMMWGTAIASSTSTSGTFAYNTNNSEYDNALIAVDFLDAAAGAPGAATLYQQLLGARRYA